MFRPLIELILPRIIGIVVHKREKLTRKELNAQESFMAELEYHCQPKTSKPVIIAMIGPVGSGKSSVAKELARHIGATVIEGDAIRVELRKQGERFERARAIAENAAISVVKHGGNAILDSDFVDAKKRASLREKARRAGVRVVFIRTYCDLDVMSQRIRGNDPGKFFNWASTKSTATDRGKDAKFREMWRRTPHHYTWVNSVGGQWVLRKFPFTIFAEIDTTDPDKWKHAVEECAKKLLER